MERLDKFLSRELNITRSEAKSFIKAGGVRLNFAVVRSADMKIDPKSDRVFANGQELAYKRFVYIMMNKPKGVISSSDGRKTGEKTVVDILPDEMKRKGLFPAGRLDKDTTGFVLITDDGGFNKQKLFFIQISCLPGGQAAVHTERAHSGPLQLQNGYGMLFEHSLYLVVHALP